MDDIDSGRRRFLLGTSGILGGIGCFFASIPFLSSLWPSSRAQAAGGPVECDISELKPGQMKQVPWRGKPIFIIKRSKEMIDSLPKLTPSLRDPNSEVNQQPGYAKNTYRSLNPDILVLVGVCTHLGCSPKLKAAPGEMGPSWPGGFYCPCHGSKFDMAGRVFKGVPAPINLEVPPYKFINDNNTIVIGEDPEAQSD